MREVEHQGVGKMGMGRVQHKIGAASQDREAPCLRQALIFGLAEVHDQRNRGGLNGGRAQKAYATRLDQAADRVRAAGDQSARFHGQGCLVIGHQRRPKRNQPQRKRGFA